MDDRKSTLTINAYNQMGENIQYDCHHGTQTYRHTLNLTVENFRCKLLTWLTDYPFGIIEIFARRLWQ